MHHHSYPALHQFQLLLLITILGLLLPLTRLAAEAAPAHPVHLEAEGLVVMEAEMTQSPLGNWKREAVLENFTGQGYLRFDGNTYIMGPPDSPLVYRFRITTPGIYTLHLRCAKEIIDDRTDIANDAYVRVEGKFQALPGPYDKHGDNADLKTLTSDTKFFGGEPLEFTWAAGNRLDLGGHKNKRRARYIFQSGETYTLVISGRSRHFRIDRIIFCHESVATEKAYEAGREISELTDKK